MKWILVTERFPEEGRLCFVKEGDRTFPVPLRWDGETWEGMKSLSKNITAWWGGEEE